MKDITAQAPDYRTHILIGSAANGKMTVICSWPHLPRQAEVERAMDAVTEAHATFLLCTATSIMPAKIKAVLGGKQGSARPFRPRKIAGNPEAKSTPTRGNAGPLPPVARDHAR